MKEQVQPWDPCGYFSGTTFGFKRVWNKSVLMKAKRNNWWDGHQDATLKSWTNELQHLASYNSSNLSASKRALIAGEFWKFLSKIIIIPPPPKLWFWTTSFRWEMEKLCIQYFNLEAYSLIAMYLGIRPTLLSGMQLRVNIYSIILLNPQCLWLKTPASY